VASYDIAVVGGTGPQGRGLAYRWALHGHRVVVGSRSAERAAEAAARIRQRLPQDAAASVRSATNAEAAETAEVVVLAVPYDGHDDLVRSLAGRLAGKVVVSCVNALGFDKQGPYGLDVPQGSAAQAAQSLAPDARVVGGFHHVSAANLWGKDEYLDHEDVLVCGDDAEAKALVAELARAVTSRAGIDAGRLRMARELETWTAVLISINKRYKARSGTSISGIPRD
jgi:NADPH-dependent F420 reductase